MIDWLKNIWQRLRATASGDASEAGARGEAAAVDYLQRRHGFALVTRNWRSPRDRRDEIDIIARDGDVLVFVEVKARGAGARVPGYYTINPRKKRVLRRAVHAYLSALQYPPRTFRFDVVEVTLHDRLPLQCLHFENIPLFPKGYHAARQN